MHPFVNVPEGELESLNMLQEQFQSDCRLEKADLMCGVYQTEEGHPYVLPSVKKAKQMLFDNQTWDHEYPSSHLGEASFRDLSARLLFGDYSQVICAKRLASMQALGASGACHMGAKLLRAHYEPYHLNPEGKVYIPKETWVNHPNIFRTTGFETVDIPYHNSRTHAFDFQAFNGALKEIPSQSIVVLQACGNNPTGCDPSVAEWAGLASTFRAMGHFAFLDISYLGFVSGNAEHDCAPIRLFASAGIPMLVAATYGKAFGLYGERVGHLCLPLPSPEIAARVEKQMKLLARAETGAQPRFGAKVVELILGSPQLRTLWESDLKRMARDLTARRERLKRALLQLDMPGNWDFVTNQVGMFWYTSFSPEQVDHLREEHAVYLQDSGRLSIAGLNSENTAHVAASINKTLRRETQKWKSVSDFKP